MNSIFTFSISMLVLTMVGHAFAQPIPQEKLSPSEKLDRLFDGPPPEPVHPERKTIPVLNVEPVSWRHTKECGVNCLYVLLRMHGIETTYEVIRSEVQLSEQGASLAELSRVADQHGFPMVPVRVTPESLVDCPLPVIIHLRRPNLSEHYVLLTEHPDPDRFGVLDCTTGEYRTWQAGEFNEVWTGYALISSTAITSSWKWIVAAIWITLGFILTILAVRYRTRKSQVPGPNERAEKIIA